MGCKGDSCNAKVSCWCREVFCQVKAGFGLVLALIVELLVFFTGFFSPWFVQHPPWCPGVLSGCRGTPDTHQCPTEKARAAGGSEEHAARREPLKKELRKKGWKDGKDGFGLLKGKRNCETLIAEDIPGYRNSSAM